MSKKITKANIKKAAQAMVAYHGSPEAAMANNVRAINLAESAKDGGAVETLNRVQGELQLMLAGAR